MYLFDFKIWSSSLEIKPVEVARTTAKEVFIRSGIEHGSLVVRSAVPNPYNGMKVRLPGDEPVLSDAAESDASEDNDTVFQRCESETP